MHSHGVPSDEFIAKRKHPYGFACKTGYLLATYNDLYTYQRLVYFISRNLETNLLSRYALWGNCGYD